MTDKIPEALAVLDRALVYLEGMDGVYTDAVKARAAVAELIEDANRWRAVTVVYAGFQTRGDQMVAYISTPQWVGDWSDFNNAIDRHFEINGAALTNVGGAS